MSATVVCIADTDQMARALDRYLRCFLGSQIESYFMTYERRILSGKLFMQVDLFVLELFRRDDIGFRAEAIPVAEKWLTSGKRVLLFSGAVRAENIKSQGYWDLGAADALHKRVRMLLSSPTPSPDELKGLRSAFAAYCRPPADHHHRYPDVSPRSFGRSSEDSIPITIPVFSDTERYSFSTLQGQAGTLLGAVHR